MIRQLIRRPVGRLVAVAAVFGIASTGTAPLLAAGAERPREEKPASAAWFLQVLNGKGEVLDFEKAIHAAKSPTAPTPGELPGDIARLRDELQAREKSAMDLIRFGGHLPKGGYDVPNGRNEKPTAPSAVHG